MQKKADDLRAQIDARQKDLTEQMLKSVGDQQATAIADAQRKLDADKAAMDQAKADLEPVSMEYLEASTAEDNAKTIGAQIDDEHQTLARLEEKVNSAITARDALRNNEATHAFDIEPLSASSITSRTMDLRPTYSLYAIAGLAVFFAFLTFITSGAWMNPAPAYAPHPNSTRRRRPIQFIPPADALSIPSPARNGNGDNGHDADVPHEHEFHDDDDEEHVLPV
jgi:hypothetical protein